MTGLSVERHGDGLAVVTLDDAERRNPLGHGVRQALTRALSEAEADDAVRAVVLTGAGGQFSVGGDIRDQGARSPAEQRERFATVKDMVGRMVHLSKPLVAAVEGWAAGGGFALAMACPVVVVARDARFTAAFTKIGLIPDMGLLATLPARIGPAKARRIILSNRTIGAEEALALGMAEEMAEPGAALARACAIAREEAEGAPLPRQFVLDWFAREVDAALDYERSLQPMLLGSEDAAEGRRAFFEKRAPRFRGR
ncbi:enoyl-CoA hydratase/isomerase family protein [Jannaschia rubra]|uniref:Putative enoyl-CoA hydratase echA8 n=1 Tax=Jannaschia rubra TaxID=282197 RepID=A0A0M6XML0_9RHOB|nr:enoyl-CoA hydratase/isomerase family protein [Jannaschia rubra]CTQ31264.1 putative enoyl-CoA hydratase echA8 [Jannaschia rubra]SFF90165.1 Enoyl-CoA hydratase/carnithine racemase [Jannaschia rubra]